MATFAKKPVPSSVSFAHAEGQMETLEGLVKYQAGDALMTGCAGEHWPISRATFEATYEPCEKLLMGFDGMYVKKFIRICARQVEIATVVDLGHQRGALTAKVGDWVVTDTDGKQWVVADLIFRETYAPV
jgi:hypothetical protein